MTPDPTLPEMRGLHAHQLEEVRDRLLSSGLNMTRARALLLAHRRRALRPGEQAEFDQALALIAETTRAVKDDMPALPSGRNMQRAAELLGELTTRLYRERTPQATEVAGLTDQIRTNLQTEATR